MKAIVPNLSDLRTRQSSILSAIDLLSNLLVRHSDQFPLSLLRTRRIANAALTLHATLTRWHSTVAADLETAFRQSDNLAHAVFRIIGFIFIDLSLTDTSHSCHQILGFVDRLDQSRVTGLEQLEQCPDSDVLERRVARRQETLQVAMYAS